MLTVRSFRQGQVTAGKMRGLLALLRDGGEQKTEEILNGMAVLDTMAST